MELMTRKKSRHRLPEAVANLQSLPVQRLGFLIAATSLPRGTPVRSAGAWVRKVLTPPSGPGSERWASLCSTALLKTSRIFAPGIASSRPPAAKPSCSSNSACSDALHQVWPCLGVLSRVMRTASLQSLTQSSQSIRIVKPSILVDLNKLRSKTGR